eukprot:COSAG02_NODE_5808_length_4022_cov_5.665052_4_plen_168_part_00
MAHCVVTNQDTCAPCGVSNDRWTLMRPMSGAASGSIAATRKGGRLPKATETVRHTLKLTDAKVFCYLPSSLCVGVALKRLRWTPCARGTSRGWFYPRHWCVYDRCFTAVASDSPSCDCSIIETLVLAQWLVTSDRVKTKRTTKCGTSFTCVLPFLFSYISTSHKRCQ